jgi:motility quorum-sensing regulator/GCU-specific mRNA interferase toxin
MTSKPTYNLATFQELYPQHRQIVPGALADALKMGFSSQDIEEVILNLTPSDFYKTMPSEKKPGLWQDVYRPRHFGMTLYVKIQIINSNTCAVLISFKEK